MQTSFVFGVSAARNASSLITPFLIALHVFQNRAFSRTGLLPRDQIAVMLHDRNQHFIARLQIIRRPGVAYQIQALRRISCKNDLLRALRVDESTDSLPGVLI
jgi:hypothetical protein